MKKSLALLKAGFVSSSGTTPEFKAFVSVFKSEFKKELATIKATDIKFNVGHFYISGFFVVNGQTYYFSVSDVRCYSEGSTHFGGLMYRTAKSDKDYTGGCNMYVSFEPGMCLKMRIES